MMQVWYQCAEESEKENKNETILNSQVYMCIAIWE